MIRETTPGAALLRGRALLRGFDPFREYTEGEEFAMSVYQAYKRGSKPAVRPIRSTCPRCAGSGVSDYIRASWDAPGYDEPCPRCGGSGYVRRAA